MFTNYSSKRWGDRLLAGALTGVLIVAGVFAGLVVLALVGAMALVVGARLWWIKRQSQGRVIDAEYRVLP